MTSTQRAVRKAKRLTRPQMVRALGTLERAKRAVIRQGDRCVRLAYAEADEATRRTYDRLSDAEVAVLASFTGGER